MMALERIIYTIVVLLVIWIVWYSIRGLIKDKQPNINVPPQIDVRIKKDESE